MKVVQQPFGRRTDVVPGTGLHADVVMGFTQYGNIAFDARKEGAGTRRSGGAMGLRQTAPMLGKALGAKNLGSNGCLHFAARARQDVTQGVWCLRDQAAQRGAHRHPKSARPQG